MRSPITAVFVLLAASGVAPAQALKVVEKVAEAMVRQEGRLAGRAAIQMGVGQMERRFVLHESDEVVQMLARRLPTVTDEAVLARRFDRLQGVDDALRAEFRALPVADRRLVVELGEGAQRLLRRTPADDAAALLQGLDAGGLAQARTYGDFVFDGAQWLRSEEVVQTLAARTLAPDEAASVTRLLGLNRAPEAIRAEDVIPLWRSVIRKTGAGAGRFWKEYVEPHKAKWLAGGLLAVYLIAPESFHDTAGSLSEYAARKLSEMGFSVAAAVGRGAVLGPVEAFQKRYADDPAGTLAALAVSALLLLLAVPRFRRFVGRHLAGRLRADVQSAPTTVAGFHRHEPLRE